MKKNKNSVSPITDFNPDSDWLQINTIDMHTGGEPLRIIYEGLPEIMGETILEKRAYFKKKLDHFRTGLMYEPRGHADMYGAVITKPQRADSDFGVLFLHNEGYSTMCGHAIIALVKFAATSGLFMPEKSTFNIDVPAGQIKAHLNYLENKLSSTSFQNVPSFVYLENQNLILDGIGKVPFSIAFGGAFYVICNAENVGINLNPSQSQSIIAMGTRIKKQVIQAIEIKHPFYDDLGFLYGVIFTAKSEKAGIYSKNACVFANGELDRSATGSGVSARAALLFKQKKIKQNETITIESIIGSVMQVKIADTVKYDQFEAVIPEVTGQAYFTGKHTFYFEPNDQLNKGFIIR